MQNDFIDGALGTKEAEAIISNVKNKIMDYQKNGEEIIFTRDTHQANYLSTNEGKHLPVEHCIESSNALIIKAAYPEIKVMDIYQEELEFLNRYDITKFEHPSIAADIAIFSIMEDGVQNNIRKLPEKIAPEILRLADELMK